MITLTVDFAVFTAFFFVLAAFVMAALEVMALYRECCGAKKFDKETSRKVIERRMIRSYCAMHNITRTQFYMGF